MKRRIALLALAATVAVPLAAGVASSSTKVARTPTEAGTIDPAAIPLGDGYVSTTPQVGYVDACQTSFTGKGAFADGPWIDESAKTWDDATKLSVSGSVSWSDASYAETVSGSTRTVAFNDLPTTHTTGVFPIASSDPAYQYDRNPNHIAAQSVTWNLPLDPTAASTPQCVGMGAIGVLADGVYLYNALDAEGRDAGAHEVLDACAGHPDESSSYHHHDVPPCLLSKGEAGRSVLVGYALDGYGIYVTEDANGNLPTNTDLDACHGTTSAVPWNGTTQTVYHYVATLEYPYTVGCYHGTPISTRGGGSGSAGGGGKSSGGSPPGQGGQGAGGPGAGGPGAGGPGGGKPPAGGGAGKQPPATQTTTGSKKAKTPGRKKPKHRKKG